MIKRLFDILIAGLGLIILAPVFLLIALLIKCTSRGDIFFRQGRVGRNGTIFFIHKFRTMYERNSELAQQELRITIGNDKRITRVGNILRKTKLDELPQLIDVVSGKMALVGPRPEVPEFVAIYPPEIKNIVLSVRPGITDWASIKMIDEAAILAQYNNPRQAYIEQILPQKLAYAVKYVKTQNFIQDCMIILMTILKIIKR